MTDFISDLIFDLENDTEFEENPLPLREWVVSPDHLALKKPLSENQFQIVEASTQIFRRDTLHKLYGFEAGEERWKQTYTEVIMQLGKGSGKDFMSTVACAYIVYQLLCLKDPAGYYDKNEGDTIDIVNIAINAKQAQSVFFKNFKERIERAPWFAGKYKPLADAIEFDKNITVYSGHSEREAWEGYNVLLAVLDEISGFAIDSPSGNENAKTGEAVYDMYRDSVDSRFPDLGKCLLLSFPRFRDDFIQTKYEKAIKEKETIIRSHTFKIVDDDPLLEDVVVEGNSITIEWEEDHIIEYEFPGVFALKRPSWEVNPIRDISHYRTAFIRDATKALAKFACMPPMAIDALFKSKEKVETAFSDLHLAIDEEGRFSEWFKPKDYHEYYMHVDLAQKHDRCAVAMVHVDKWVKMNFGGSDTLVVPKLVVDFVRYWIPTKEESVDLTKVNDFILDVRSRGFNIKKVTFDRWHSHEHIIAMQLNNIESEILSVAKKHYDDMVLAVSEERVKGPHIPMLIDELLKLRIIKDKVDHPRNGFKDLSDATCGAIFNAVTLTNRLSGEAVEVHSYQSLPDDNFLEEKKSDRPGELIHYVRDRDQEAGIPDDLQQFLDGLVIL